MMKLTSPAYRNGETMPARFATAKVVGGTGVSVPFAWEDPPPATRSFVLAIIDTHPVARGWVHWLVTDIPLETRALPEGASRPFGLPFPALEHPNTAGNRGYGGPQPPVGSGVHDYVANLYALDVTNLDVATDAIWEEVRAAMSGHVLENVALVGRFGR
jgi:Raf kinase inhibitor-like YbhB/YbcL family protein